MAGAHWTLTDAARGVNVPEFLFSPRMPDKYTDATNWFPGNAEWSVAKRTLHGGLSEGVDVVDVFNGKLQFSILPTRGMSLFQGNLGGVFLGWKSPVEQPVHPKFVNLAERGGLGWLFGYNEWMCRCGLESNGAPGLDVIPNNQGVPTQTQLTLHGRIGNVPAHHLEVRVTPGNEGKISVTGLVDEAMMFGPHFRLKATYETTPGSNSLTIIDEVTNLKSTPGELELLYHTNFGSPLIDAGAKLVAPFLDVAPRDEHAAKDIDSWDAYLGPTPGYVEQVYWMELAAKKSGDTLVLLRNAHGEKGAVLRFNKNQLPCFTQWKNTAAEQDGYVTGLEPATNYPNLKTFERQQGRVINLAPGQTYTTRLQIDILTTADQVATAEEEIKTLQTQNPGRVHRSPQKKYSPA